MKKSILVLTLIAGGSWAGTTYYTGTQTQATYTRLLEQLNTLAKDIIVLESKEYTPGVMESTAITEVRSANGSGKDIQFSLKHQINHSLISVASENARFGAANIITTLVIDENYSEDNKAFLNSFESGEPFVATTDVALDGATNSKITINAVDHSESGKHMQSGGAVINLATTANGNVTGDAIAEHFMFSASDDEKGELSNLSMKFSMESTERDNETTARFYDLNTESTLDEFKFADGSKEQVSLSNLSAKINLKELGDGTGVSPLFYVLHPEEINPEKIDFDKLNYEAKVGDIDFAEGTNRKGKLSDMIMKIGISKLENQDNTSPIFYDVNIESETAEFNLVESNNPVASISDMSIKLNLDKFGNGKKLSETLLNLESEILNPEDMRFDGLNLESKLAEMDVVEGPDDRISTSDMSMKINMTKLGDTQDASPFFFDLNMDAKLGKIDVVEDAVQLALIKDAHYMVEQNFSADEPSSLISIGVDSMVLEAVPLQSFDADLALTGFSTKELLANESFFVKLKASRNPEKVLLSEEAVDLMRATVKPGTKLVIKLDAKSTEGDGTATADLWFSGNGSDDGFTGMVTLGDLAKSFAATAIADIDKGVILLTPLGEMLEHPMAQAYLTITEDKVSLNATLDKLVLKINEQIIPLDLMAGERLNMPLEKLTSQ